jgi:dipeptidase E
MMKLILTSDFPSTGNDVVIDCMRSVVSRPRIAWIPPFTDVNRERFNYARQQFGTYGFSNLEYVDIDAELDETLISHLERYDIVYLSGGDPIRFLLNLMRRRLSAHLRDYIDKGRLLVTASGGSLQITPNVSLYRLQSASIDEVFKDRNEYNALGFVRYELLPHLNRLSPEFLEKVRQYSERVEHDILAIPDGSAVLHKDLDDYRCDGRAVSFRNGAINLVEAAA